MAASEAPVMDICDYVVTSIKDRWKMNPLDSCCQEFDLPLDIREEKGRHVWVYPLKYQDIAADQGESDIDTDVYIHRTRVGVTTSECYPRADDISTLGRINKEWLRERVHFVWTKIYKTFRKRIPSYPQAITIADEVTVVYHEEFLKQGVFWSECEFEFQYMS